MTAVDPTNPTDGAVAKALEKIKGWLKERIYIPIVIGGEAERHRALQRDPPLRPELGYLIHDPGKGHSGWVTTRMIMENNMAPPLAWSHLAGYDTPTKKAKK